MRYGVPHPIPYQGSKRRLASTILGFVGNDRFQTLYEPFAGSAALTLAAASDDKCKRFVISDVLEPLTGIWREVLADPIRLATAYAELWHGQTADPERFFYNVRGVYNKDRDPAKLLFLIARCVKNAVRFSKAGEFNQSPDKRRKGTHPETMRSELLSAHNVLVGRTSVRCMDYKGALESANRGDLLYLDPPYQGTSEGRNRRYVAGVSRVELISELEKLNHRGVEFLLSYDGACGQKTYGEHLPMNLARRCTIKVGRSSQATLNGNDHVTWESLYVSHGFALDTAQVDYFDLDPPSTQNSLALESVIS